MKRLTSAGAVIVSLLCFYNGNTFAAIIRDVIAQQNLAPTTAAIVRSLAGHIVAGVATDEEEKAFCGFCESLEQA